MNSVVECIRNNKLVAIIRTDDLSTADQIVHALLAGGIRVIEFTLTNRESLEVVTRLRDQLDQFDGERACLGIGSVTTAEDARAAIDAGAQFIVTPVLATPVLKASRQRETPVACGAMTPSEIWSAWSQGADFVKVFPARALGPEYIRDVLAPLPQLRLIPTGGVDLQNLAAYLNAGAEAVGIGSCLVKSSLIRQGDWSGLERLAQAFVDAAQVNRSSSA